MTSTESSGNRRGCFKLGCFGCLAVVVLIVGLPLLLGLIGFLLGAPDSEYEAVDVSQPLPAAPQPEAALEDPAADLPLAPPGTAAPTDDLGGENRQVLNLDDSFLAPPPAGTIRLDLAMGEFKVEPSAPGEGVRIEGDYDRGTFDLEEVFTESPDGTWEYAVKLRNKVSWLRRMWGNGQVDNALTIFLPREQPLELVGKVSTGASDLELGGLWLTQVDLELATGEHTIRFSEPSREPLDRLKLSGSFGEIKLVGIGNASPAWASLEGKFGDFDVDLAGAWRGDSQMAIGFQFGECRVRLPTTAKIEVDRTKMSFGERSLDLPAGQADLPDSAPTLRLDLQGSFGEMRVAP